MSLTKSGTRPPIARIALLAASWMIIALVLPFAVQGQDTAAFPTLNPDQPVIDETGNSLTSDQLANLELQIDQLAATGAEVVVLVRNLDATPNETLDQVEALQQAWVAASGSNQDTTIAVLINRNPDDPHDARAGIFVGRTYNEGNIPEDEQRDIVSDVLIPPLRSGDVYGSFSDTLTRLESDILHGPPQSAFEEWSSSAATSWLPWVGGGLAAIAAAGGYLLFGRRQTIDQSPLPPTTTRPEPMMPALAGALVAGSPQSSAFPATLLDLAGRGALQIEPESQGGTFSKPTIRVRLRDDALLHTPEEGIVWAALVKRADVGVVSSKNLPRAATDANSNLSKHLTSTMRDRGWLDATGSGARSGIMIIAIVAVIAAVGLFIVSAVGEAWQGIVAAGVLLVAGIGGFILFGNFSSLSRAGQVAALPWKAYRDGLKEAAKTETLPLDLDDILADAVAFNLGSSLDKRMKTAVDQGVYFRAFSAATTGSTGYAPIFPWWIAYNSSIATASGSGSSSVVSGGGAGGGGGAAGST